MDHNLLLQFSSPTLTGNETSQLRREYFAAKSLFQAQPGLVQQYLSSQATVLAEAIIQGHSQAGFMLPDNVIIPSEQGDSTELVNVPEDKRTQVVRAALANRTYQGLSKVLSERLSELGKSSDKAVAVSAELVRYAVAFHMVYNILPTGKSVVYTSVMEDDIPNQPVDRGARLESAIGDHLDTNAKEAAWEKERGELIVPYVEMARRFYLPQWVAFDGDNMLVNTIQEAEAHITSMQNYLAILQYGLVVAPYMIADEVWQQKRYGILGQLVNQGRAMAHYQMQAIIQTIQRRVAEHRLNRGLRLSLPYFNDRTFKIENHDFTIIPAGRIMFTPAFAVLAARKEQIRVAQNTNLSFTTRKYLIWELRDLELAFTR